MNRRIPLSFMLLGILFSVCLVASNLLAVKPVCIFGLSATAGLIIFPVSYIINDTIVEVWGYRKARLVIWTAFAVNFMTVVFVQLSVKMPPAPYWDGQEAYTRVFVNAPRAAFASFVAFLAGSFVNAIIMSRMKVRSRGRGFGVRAIVSTLFGETVDSVLFFTFAFAGIFEWSDISVMIVTQIFLKSAYEAAVLPVTAAVARYVKRTEQTDVYDCNISYNILKIKDLS